MSIFKGAGVAIVTPMKPDGAVNYEVFAKLIEFQISNNTDAIIVCGTTGEASTLTHEEHIECIRFCVQQVAKRVPVIAGTGSNCTETAIYLSKEAQKAGADGLLLVTPYYNKATQKGLKEHFKMIAQAVDIPIILYNIPGRTGGVNILPETIVSLCEEEANIVGAKGVISVLSNIAPQQTHDICAKYFEGNVEESARLQLEAIELISALFSEVNPIPVKKALNLMGLEAGTLRRPLTEMEDTTTAKLEQAMKNYGIL